MPSPLRIRFGLTGNAATCQPRGFHPPEQDFTWSSGRACHLTLCAPADGDAVLALRARPFVLAGARPRARLRVGVNGSVLATIQAVQETVLALRLPALSAGQNLDITIEAPDCVRPSDFGLPDTRLLGVALSELVLAPRGPAIAALLARIAATFGPPADEPDARLARWAADEMLPWALLPGSRAALAPRLRARNVAGWCAVFTLRGGAPAEPWPKPPETELSPTIAGRLAAYQAFLTEACAGLPNAFGADVCVCLADSLTAHYPEPMMTFEKRAPAAALLVPDVEYCQNVGFAAPAHQDPFGWNEKQPRAVFAGATTGGPITEAVARAAALPRLRAAAHFDGNPHVDFRLTAIVQCTDEAAEAVLRAAPYCQRPPLDWQAQYAHRFVISMDGNGAPWSRQYLGLRGRSALLKYQSPNLLYYHRGIRPQREFVQIRQDQDVSRVVAMEQANPGLFRPVGEAGATFAATYLTAEMRRRYMAMLLVAYAGVFQ